MPDLCTLADVKTWLGITDTASDAVLSRLISSTSQDFVNEIRRPSLVPSAAFSDVLVGKLWAGSCYWNGFYAVGNWNGWQQTRKQEIYLSQYPVNSITTVTLDGTVLDEVTDPTDLTQSGWFFDDTLEPENRQKLILVGLSYFGENSGQRLQIDFNAGYANVAVTDELATVPATAPYTVAVAGAANFASNTSVKYSVAGTTLVKVSGVPTVGQYAVDSAGTYTFAAADAGMTMKISYATMGVPVAIREAVIEWVAFKRGQSQLQSANQAVGSFKMGDYEQTNAVSGLTLAVLKASIPENVQRAIDQYRKQIPF